MSLSNIVAYVAIGSGIAGILTFLIGVLPARKLAHLRITKNKLKYFSHL